MNSGGSSTPWSASTSSLWTLSSFRRRTTRMVSCLRWQGRPGRARTDASGEISAIAAADMVYDFLSILALGVKDSPQLQAVRDEL